MAYSVSDYAQMTADKVRMSSYLQAFERGVKEGSVVLDLGTGLGTFALIACRLGASRVYAIEPNESVVVARALARANGFSSRIEFLQCKSQEVNLQEHVDVIVSDLRGQLPFSGGHIEAIADARKRFLKPTGQLLPKRDLLLAAVVESPEAFEKCVHPWQSDDFGLDLTPLKAHLTETASYPKITASQLLTEPQQWFEIDYMTVEDPDAAGAVRQHALRDGVGHGILVWFEAWIDDIEHFSGGPGSELEVYGHMFFPWSKPVDLKKGDLLEMKIAARSASGNYFWNWSTRIESANGVVKAQFRQSTFNTESPTPRQLKEASAKSQTSS